MGVGRHRNRRFVPAVVGITGLALGRTVAPIGLAAVRTAVVAPVPAVVGITGLALGRTVTPIGLAAVRTAVVVPVPAVVAVSRLTF